MVLIVVIRWLDEAIGEIPMVWNGYSMDIFGVLIVCMIDMCPGLGRSKKLETYNNYAGEVS